MNDIRELMRPADVAPLLGVTTGRIYQLIAAGLLPSVRIGRAIRIPRATWEEWLREKEKLASVSLRGEVKPESEEETG